MYSNKKILAVIPARGGSKRLPGKNIKLLGNKPLIAWTIEAAKNSKLIDRIILSSDDQEIIAVAEQYGCEVPFVRPSYLALDETSSEMMLEHAIISINETFDYIVLLQPTSPFRMAQDIDDCIRICIDKEVLSVESMTPISENPEWMYYVNENNSFRPVCNCEIYKRNKYILNGSIYVIECSSFLNTLQIQTSKTLAYIMPKNRSIDIDTLEDFNYAEYLLKNILNHT